jgi:hypothetical protein
MPVVKFLKTDLFQILRIVFGSWTIWKRADRPGDDCFWPSCFSRKIDCFEKQVVSFFEIILSISWSTSAWFAGFTGSAGAGATFSADDFSGTTGADLFSALIARFGSSVIEVH